MKNNKPTKKQIKQEIMKLKDLAPNIRQYSVFGGDNRAQIEAQIYVLEHNSDDDEVFGKFEHIGIEEEILGAALGAVQWLDGEYELDTLSEEWEALDQRNKTQEE